MNQKSLFLLCFWLMAAISLSAAETTVPGSTNEKQASKPAASDSGKSDRKFAIQTSGDLILSIPSEWNSSSRPMNGATPGEVILVFPKSGYEWIASIEAINVGTNATKELDAKRILAEAGKTEATNSVEQTLTIKDFKSETVSGSYFSLTDKRLTITAPKEGEYKHLTQGYAKLDGIVLSFRIVSNRISKEDEKAVFDAIKSARFVPRH